MIILALLLGLPQLAWAAKTDILRLDNGDRITGEIKKLERGRLTYSTDDMDKISVEWNHVAALVTANWYQLELSDGSRNLGSFLDGAPPGTLRLRAAFGDTLDIPMDSIVYMTRMKRTFLSRVTGSFDLGFGYTSANNLVQWTFAGQLNYRGEKHGSSITVNSILSDQDSVATTSRQDAAFQLTRFMKHRFNVQGTLQLQQNQELGIQLRVLTGLSVGYNFVQSNHALFGVDLGASVTSQTATDGSQSEYAVEGIIGSSLSMFTYERPKKSLDIAATVYPTLSGEERYRFEVNIQLKWELIKDFYVSGSLLDSYDSDPPASASGAKNDASFTTSLGYTF